MTQTRRGYHDHFGNIRFRSLLEDCHQQYDNASRDEKTKITEEIVGIVKEAGGRFLKDSGNGWEVVEDSVARLKVSGTFRAMRLKNKAIDEKERVNMMDAPLQTQMERF